MTAHVEYQEEECTMNFLMGLNDSFSSVKGHILLMQLLPSLKKVFSLIIQEERQRRVGTMLLLNLLPCSQGVLIPLTKGKTTPIDSMVRKKGLFALIVV